MYTLSRINSCSLFLVNKCLLNIYYVPYLVPATRENNERDRFLNLQSLQSFYGMLRSYLIILTAPVSHVPKIIIKVALKPPPPQNALE